MQRRRASSFAEYFDVDFGQSLLSRLSKAKYKKLKLKPETLLRKQFSRKNSYALDLAQRLEKENTNRDSLYTSTTTSVYNGNEAKTDGEHTSLLNVSCFTTCQTFISKFNKAQIGQSNILRFCQICA